MATIHTLTREEVIETDLETAWTFISRPENLNKITPPELDFEIVSDLPETMFEGLTIQYRIGIPLLGKQSWLTEIKHIRDHHSFIDEQRIGPYRLWYHYHEISELTNGVRFVDRVQYVMPFGRFGELARLLYVRRQLKYIFDYRRQAMLRELG
ncbi:MAG: SRPBCC family protein [Coraliomargarita sp.]